MAGEFHNSSVEMFLKQEIAQTIMIILLCKLSFLKKMSIMMRSRPSNYKNLT